LESYPYKEKRGGGEKRGEKRRKPRGVLFLLITSPLSVRILRHRGKRGGREGKVACPKPSSTLHEQGMQGQGEKKKKEEEKKRTISPVVSPGEGSAGRAARSI